MGADSHDPGTPARAGPDFAGSMKNIDATIRLGQPTGTVGQLADIAQVFLEFGKQRIEALQVRKARNGKKPSWPVTIASIRCCRG